MINKFKKYISDNNIEEALKIVEMFGDQKNESALPILLEIFESTDNNILRNQISIALSDIGNPIAIEPMIKMISNPKSQKSRGTLLYALKSFDCSRYLKLFITLLSDRNLEVSREAFSCIESMYQNVSNIKKIEYANIVKEEIEIISDRLELLTEAYELFDEDTED